MMFLIMPFLVWGPWASLVFPLWLCVLAWTLGYATETWIRMNPSGSRKKWLAKYDESHRYSHDLAERPKWKGLPRFS